MVKESKSEFYVGLNLFCEEVLRKNAKKALFMRVMELVID